jgi:hypothetical protein
MEYRVYIKRPDQQTKYIKVATPEEGLDIVLTKRHALKLDTIGIEQREEETDNDWTEWFFEYEGVAWGCGSLTLVDGEIDIQ